MAGVPSQKELLRLSQTKDAGLEFLETAAKFLKYDLPTPLAGKSDKNGVKAVRKSLAPREDFVLRLLLKRFSGSTEVLQPKFWLLLSYLIEIVPIKNLSRQIAEHGFFKALPHVLELIQATILNNNRSDFESDTTSDLDSSRPSKRRKLGLAAATTFETSSNFLPSLVCQSIANLVQLAEGKPDVDEILRSVLSAESEHAATVVERLLELVQISSGFQETERRVEYLNRVVPFHFAIWKNRRPEAAGTKNSPDQQFTAHCLRPSLSILNEIEAFGDESVCLDVTSIVERHIALHSVLPLRSIFLAEKAQQWKSRTISIDWNDFKDLHSVVGLMLLKVNPTGLDQPSRDEAESIVNFFNIAVRSVPRSTVRIMQREQAWLDCLFCVCAYLSTPDLPKMISGTEGRLEIEASFETRSSGGPSKYLEKLFEKASTVGVKLSLQVLHYFATSTIECGIDQAVWQVLVQIMEHDLNVFVPNSGISGTKILLEKVLSAISTTNNTSRRDYVVIRDGFVRPLLKGFSQARDLKGFISIWINCLQDSIQQRVSGEIQYGKLHPGLVWEDNLVFQDFEALIKTLPTTTLSRSMMAETLELLQEASKRIGPTSDILSHTAIASSLLRARPEDFDSSAIEQIFASIILALTRRTDYQQQRWRLWRLLCQCVSVSGQKVSSFTDEIQKLKDKNILVSLATVNSSNVYPQSYAEEANLKEILECFHLRVLRAINSQTFDSTFLEPELPHLIEMFSATKKFETDWQSGENKTADFNLPLLCTAKFLQYPQILTHFGPQVALLVAAMVKRMHLSSHPEENNDLRSLVKALLVIEEVSSNYALLNHCCSELVNLTGADGEISAAARDILTSVLLRPLKKSLLQRLADSLLVRPSSNFDSSSSEEALADLGLLEMVIDVASVSIGKPKKWADFVKLANHILTRTENNGSKQYQVAVGCLSNMLTVLWKRHEDSDSSKDVPVDIDKLRSRLNESSRTSNTQVHANIGDEHQLTAESIDIIGLKNTDIEQLAARIGIQASSLGPEKAGTLAELLEQQELQSGDFLLLGAIICQISSGVDPSIAFDQSLSKIGTLQFALKAATAADLSLALETCNLVLDKHPTVMNQHTVDTLLTSINALMCPTRTTSISRSICPSAIFNRLCSLIGLILSRHRKRLGGRYHLLLPTLQSLLSCIFFAGSASPTPAQTKSQVIFIRNLPSWLRDSPLPLPSSSVLHFTRLLTTLADPSVSSIRRRKPTSKGADLTDASKKEKSLAGQYMQYLVMSYCVNSLQGRLAPESREKLLPGLYAILDVMDREVMRGMNGAMDASARAIFKDLYAEYVRFGRWDRK